MDVALMFRLPSHRHFLVLSSPRRRVLAQLQGNGRVLEPNVDSPLDHFAEVSRVQLPNAYRKAIETFVIRIWQGYGSVSWSLLRMD